MSPTTDNIEVPSQAVITTVGELKEIRKMSYNEGYEQAKKDTIKAIKNMESIDGVITYSNQN